MGEFDDSQSSYNVGERKREEEEEEEDSSETIGESD